MNSVRIVIFDVTAPGSFLVLTEADDRDNWKLPGGKFNPGDGMAESPEQAAERELMEEIDLTADQAGLVKAGELLNKDGVSARYIFVGKAARDQIKPTDEVAKLGWHTEYTLPEGENRDHILSAVALARGHIQKSS